MTNIYNKTIYFPNGTLINNWFEEEELRKKTGEGRSVTATFTDGPFPKRTFDPEVSYTSSQPRDDTYKRVIGQKEPDSSYITTNTTYGDHKHPEKKYIHKKLSQDEHDELFKKFYKTQSFFKNQMEKAKKDFRSFDTSTKSFHVAQPQVSYIGLRHMFTQDYFPVPYDKAVSIIPIEKLKKMNGGAPPEKKEINKGITKFNANGNNIVKSNSDNNFWLNNINSGNVYRSFLKKPNPFARSSGFTQLLKDTRGAVQYYQNVKNEDFTFELSEEEKRILEEERKKKEEEERKLKEEMEENLKKISTIPDMKNLILGYDTEENLLKLSMKIPQEIKDKIIKGMMQRGWVGLRLLKIFLRGLSKNKSELIGRNDFKYYLNSQAIVLTDDEVSKIFEIFDFKRSDFVNFIIVLNCFRRVSENRKNEIKKFWDQLKIENVDWISFTKLTKMVDMNYHPEATKFIKVAPEILKEYLITWDNFKEDDRVTEDQFRQYWFDISTCVDSDEDFIQIMRSVGYKD